MSVLRQAVSTRLSGDRPSVPRALLAAAVAGGVAAAFTYKALRA
jgi:hypothetical protein